MTTVVTKKTTLLQRLEWILEARQWTHEEFSKAAGFASRSHLSAIMFRLRKDPSHADRMDSGVYDKLARGARVSRSWLQFGEGTPDPTTVIPPPELAVWPNLERCLKVQPTRWSPAIVALARAQHFVADPSSAEWVTILDTLDKAVASALAPLRKMMRA